MPIRFLNVKSDRDFLIADTSWLLIVWTAIGTFVGADICSKMFMCVANANCLNDFLALCSHIHIRKHILSGCIDAAIAGCFVK